MTGVRKTGETRAIGVEPTQVRVVRAAEPAPATDSAGITDDARLLARALRAVEAAPEVRSLRVAALRKAIAEGTYRADPREIARRLLESGLADG
ncbi:flagellar biosynthesis anti-sigma factor FlgM [Tepidiforma sp.]|uniref:flagellar biosynthesis anti-sigma factor FlgM n=1 Tax=Tepidiforma sp. TaxID=2682230 RepID=UPI002ADE1119|nr:flagellar biosynthesis anti-sigma factor FlgM [Tepidiforma sp.]